MYLSKAKFNCSLCRILLRMYGWTQCMYILQDCSVGNVSVLRPTIFLQFSLNTLKHLLFLWPLCWCCDCPLVPLPPVKWHWFILSACSLHNDWLVCHENHLLSSVFLSNCTAERAETGLYQFSHWHKCIRMDLILIPNSV